MVIFISLHPGRSYDPHCLCSDLHALEELFFLGCFLVPCGWVGAVLGSSHVSTARTHLPASQLLLGNRRTVLRWRDLPGDICLLIQMDHLPSQLEANLKQVDFSPLLSQIN